LLKLVAKLTGGDFFNNIRSVSRPSHDGYFVEALPKSNYGKVLKTELRKLLAEPSQRYSPA